MQWSLEDIYKKQVRGKIPPRKHLRVLGEQMSWGFSEPGETITTTITDPKQLTFSFFDKGVLPPSRAKKRFLGDYSIKGSKY